MARTDYRKRRHTKQQGGVIRHVVGLFASFLCGYLMASVFDLSSMVAWVNHRWINPQAIATATPVINQAEAPKPKFEFYTLLSKDSHAPVSGSGVDKRQVASGASNPPTTIASNLTANAMPSAQVDAVLPLVAQANGSANPAAATVQNQAGPQVVPGGAQTKPVVAVAEGKPVLAAQPPPSSPNVVTREAYMIQIAAVTRRQDAERMKASLVLKGYGVMIISPSQSNINWYRVVIGPFHSRAEAEKAQIMVARTEHIQGMIRKIDV